MPISSVLGSSALLPAGLGMRNLLINGCFSINQRGSSSISANGYLHDRWRLEVSTGSCTYSNESFPVAQYPDNGYRSTNYARFVTSGQSSPGSLAIVSQGIEGVEQSSNAQFMVSFYARAGSGTPSIAVEMSQDFGTGGSTRVLTTAGKVQISTTWKRYFLPVYLPSITGRTIGTGSFLQVYIWLSGGSTFDSRTAGIGNQNNTFEIWGVQVERNTVATPFECRPLQVELALCQRYYQQPGSNDLSGSFYAGTAAMLFYNFPVEMRVVPALTVPPAPWTNTLLDYGVSFRTPSNVAGQAITKKTLIILAYNGYSATYIPTTWYGGNFQLNAELYG